MRLKRLVALALSVAFAAGVQPGVRAGAAQVAPTQQPSVAAASRFTVSGNVLREDRSRVAGKRVRLRSVDKGTIAAETVSDKNGAFSFPATEPGFYVVEAVDGGGSVEAVSPVQVTTISATTDVILPGKRVADTLLSSTALLLLSAAAGAGAIIWAIERNDGDSDTGNRPPVSPER